MNDIPSIHDLNILFLSITVFNVDQTRNIPKLFQKRKLCMLYSARKCAIKPEFDIITFIFELMWN